MKLTSGTHLYTNIRGSKWFLGILTAFVATWVTLHIITKIDPNFGLINLILSIEASLSVAVFFMYATSKEKEAKEDMAAVHQKLDDINAKLDKKDSA